MKTTMLAVFSAITLALALAASAAPENDYAASYAKAAAASTKALAMDAGWTVTEETLKRAEEAAAGQHYDEATALAKRAEALADASIRQSMEQKTRWQAAVIK